MDDSVVTVKGQVVIPARFRRKFGIKKGTKVRFFEKEGEIHLLPITRDFIYSNIGFMRSGGKLLKALMEEKRREREL